MKFLLNESVHFLGPNRESCPDSESALAQCTYTDGQAVLFAIIGELDDELGSGPFFAVVQRPKTTHHFNTILGRQLCPFRGTARHVGVWGALTNVGNPENFLLGRVSLLIHLAGLPLLHFHLPCHLHELYPVHVSREIHSDAR